MGFEQALQLGSVGLGIYGVTELLYLHLRRRAARLPEYRVAGLGVLVLYGVAAGIGALFGPFNAVVIALWAAPLAPIHLEASWTGWLYGWVVYELFYWVQHWLAHKVRLLWCIHSPHHAPQSMNMFVGFNHSFLESIFYMPLFLGLFPALLGVDPIVIGGLTLLDVMWGSMLHISDGVLVRRLGVLERFMQTPSHHRVHHARNVRYLDTNYNSITLLWDWLLGTLQPLRDDEPVAYGITRAVDTESFADVHFGEFRLLWRDVRGAPTWRAALSYLFRPPGWTHAGALQTAAARKARLAGAAG